MKHKLALVRVGLSLFQALFYRENKQVLGASDHVLVRYATNCADPSEAEWLTKFASILRTQTPACADRQVEPRFVFGTQLIAEGVTAIGAEVPGSTTWYGAVHRQAPPLDLVEYFDWFTGDGRLIRSNDETEPATKFRSPAS